MRYDGRQAGATFWGVLVLVALIGFVGLIALKLVPLYIENYEVSASLREVAQGSQAGSASDEQLAAALQRHLDMNDIDDVNVQKAFQVEIRNRLKILHVFYQTRVPIMGNVSALVDFHDEAEVRRVD